MSVSAPGPSGVPVDQFCHEALFYSDPESFLAATLPFLREGLDAGDAILVVESAARTELLRTGLERPPTASSSPTWTRLERTRLGSSRRGGTS